MGIVDAIAAIRARTDLDEDERRRLIYDLKVAALLGVIRVGKTFRHKGVTLRINRAEATAQPALFLDVTFNGSVTHQITIVNPPVLPAKRTGNERKDLRQALHEMLEGFG